MVDDIHAVRFIETFADISQPVGNDSALRQQTFVQTLFGIAARKILHGHIVYAVDVARIVDGNDSRFACKFFEHFALACVPFFQIRVVAVGIEYFYRHTFA